jgi:hypothetical protein
MGKITQTTKKDTLAVALPNKRIVIEVLNRRHSVSVSGGINGSEQVFLTGTKRTYPIQPKQRGGFVDPFLIYYAGDAERAAELRELLEEELGLEFGALRTVKTDAIDMAESIWSNSEFHLTFTKQDAKLGSASVELDLTNPMDFVRYLVALSWTDGPTKLIAPNWAKRDERASYKYVIRDMDTDESEQNALIELRASATSEVYGLYNTGNLEMLVTLYGYLSAKDYTFKAQDKITSKTALPKAFSALITAISNSDRVPRILMNALRMSEPEKDAWRVYFKGREKSLIRASSFSSRHKKPDGRSIGANADETVLWLQGKEGQEYKLAIDSYEKS